MKIDALNSYEENSQDYSQMGRDLEKLLELHRQNKKEERERRRTSLEVEHQSLQFKTSRQPLRYSTIENRPLQFQRPRYVAKERFAPTKKHVPPDIMHQHSTKSHTQAAKSKEEPVSEAATQLSKESSP
ncbi:hypothetical protein BGW41_008347, partial [Actinomortierella wolfii]